MLFHFLSSSTPSPRLLLSYLLRLAPHFLLYSPILFSSPLKPPPPPFSGGPTSSLDQVGVMRADGEALHSSWQRSGGLIRLNFIYLASVSIQTVSQQATRKISLLTGRNLQQDQTEPGFSFPSVLSCRNLVGGRFLVSSVQCSSEMVKLSNNSILKVIMVQFLTLLEHKYQLRPPSHQVAH